MNFSVRADRVHRLVGENGAGKSTLTKVLAGLYPPDAGTLSLDGQPLSLRGTDDALARGIVTVHQDINLIPTQTVAENIFLANEPTLGPLGPVRMGEMRARARELVTCYGIAVSPDSRVVGWFVLTRTALGKRVYAVGANRMVATLSGIRADRVKIQRMMIVGFTAAFAAICCWPGSAPSRPTRCAGWSSR